MIDFKLFDKRPENGAPSFVDVYRKALLNRNHSLEILDKLLEANRRRKELITQAETAKAHQNKVSGEIAQIKRSGGDASALIEEMGKLGAQVKEMESLAKRADDEVYALALQLPNKPHDSVPVGADASANQCVFKSGEPTNFTFKAKEHWELGELLGIIDFERAGKVTGSRFAFLRGAGAALERALIQFMMDLHSQKHGYEEMIPPFIVNSASLTGTGQLPKFKEDLFHLSDTDYFLVPTAEVPVTNFFAGETLAEEELPKKFVAYSPCFRSEAGSHGRDVRGLIRQHQFNKVELMTFAHPDNSYEILEQLTDHAEEVLRQIELPYRKMVLCTGDMGFGSAKTYDLEVWLPGQKQYREISSCSNFEDFQARRANIRFKSTGGKPRYVHTLNGSG
ncbi:MAG: serine--tRNA ligase, partial [Bdellovibrionaceae bacterium]|nr:serine--tRNA ligase [Pseudobdellovibrionaceae bacterium]